MSIRIFLTPFATAAAALLVTVFPFTEITSCLRAAEEGAGDGMLAKGKQLSNEGKNQEAVEAFTEAVRLDPHNSEAFIARANDYEALHQPDLARRDFDLAVQAAPTSAHPLLSRAVDRFFENRYEESVRDLDAAAALDPTCFEIYHWRGCAHAELGHNEQALADFTQVIDRDPEKTAYHGMDYHNRAALEDALGRHKEALADFEQAEKLGHPDPIAHADCLTSLKRWPEAVNIYDELLRDLSDLPADPHDERYLALCGRGNARRALKDLPGSEEDLKAAIVLAPTKAQAHGDLAWTQLLGNHPTEAQAEALKGLELDGSQDWIRVNLAHAYLLDNQFDLAKMLYLQDQDKLMGEEKTRAQTVLDDLAELRAAGVDHPDMARIEALLKPAPAK